MAVTPTPADPSTSPKTTPRKSEKTLTFRVLAGLALPFMYAISRYELIHPERVPQQGAFVLAPNHYSEIDPIVVGIGMWKLDRMPRFMAKASLFSIPFVGWLLKKSGQVPVQRSGGPRVVDPVKTAKEIARLGHAVVVYPEGTLTRDPDLWPMRGKTGAVRTALAAGIPVIPVAHWGAQRILPRYGKRISLFPRKTVRILFGEPVDLDRFRGKGLDPQTLTAATAVVMDAITELLEELRGEKAPAERWDPSKHNQSETGRFE